MSISHLQGMLESIAILNNGSDHGCEYEIFRLPDAASLDEALGLYFSSLYTSSKPPQPASRWQIQTTPLGQSWQVFLSARMKRWFFEEMYSPKVDEWNQTTLIEQAISYLQRETGVSEVFEVFVNPPMWYEGNWQDFAFSSATGKWLLHLGVSD